MADRDKTQASYFSVLLYLDSSAYDVSVVLAAARTFDEYAYILHDKDVLTDGSPAKPHYHVLVRNLNDDGKPSSTTIQSVANTLGIPSKFVQAGRNDNDNRGWAGCVRYLIHDTKDAADKFQYSRKDIVTNMKLDKYFGEDFDMAKRIMEYIISNRPKTFSQLCIWCVDNGCWSELRRSQYALKQVLDEVRSGAFK